MNQGPRVFREIPNQDDICQVRGKNCLTQIAFRIYCRVEGRQLQACQPCYLEWKDRAHRYGLQDRCPICTAGKVSPLPHSPVIPLPVPPVPLAGEAAKAIENAMHREGVPLDIRQHVMSRLYKEAFWLSYVHPEPATHAVGFKGSV